MNDKILTPKQKAFVDCYTGNATEAARLAGYRGNDNTLGVIGLQNLRKHKIAEAINNRAEKISDRRIMTRLERQEMWSEIARDRTKDVRERLMASKLLGASEGDFLQRVETRDVSHEEWLEIMQSEEDADNDEPTETLH